MTNLQTVSALLVLGAAFAGPAEAAKAPKQPAPAPVVVEGRNAAYGFDTGVAANANAAIRQQIELNARSHR